MAGWPGGAGTRSPGVCRLSLPRATSEVSGQFSDFSRLQIPYLANDDGTPIPPKSQVVGSRRPRGGRSGEGEVSRRAGGHQHVCPCTFLPLHRAAHHVVSSAAATGTGLLSKGAGDRHWRPPEAGQEDALATLGTRE